MFSYWQNSFECLHGFDKIKIDKKKIIHCALCCHSGCASIVCNHHPSLERDRITNDIPLVFLLMSFFTWKIAVLQKPIWQIHDSKWQKMHEDTLFFPNIECHIVIGLYVKYHKEIFILKIQIRQKNILTVSSAIA